MIFASIDPGAVNAAIAVWHDHQPVMVDDIHVVNGMIDPALLGRALKDMKVERVVVENVHSMPKQGVSSSFKFGFGAGIIHGVAGALLLPITLVSPSQWKTFHTLRGPDKEASRQLALRKWPHFCSRLERKKDADRAEALLIGDWYHAIRILMERNGHDAR